MVSRYDVWTDAGPGAQPRDPYRIARNISTTAAYSLARVLRSQGWKVALNRLEVTSAEDSNTYE